LQGNTASEEPKVGARVAGSTEDAPTQRAAENSDANDDPEKTHCWLGTAGV
jgi:hypothetical protein